MKVFVYIILKREKESIMDKFFKISERGSTIKTEIMAGLTTFFAMIAGFFMARFKMHPFISTMANMLIFWSIQIRLQQRAVRAGWPS